VQHLPEPSLVTVTADEARAALVVRIGVVESGPGPRTVLEHRVWRSERRSDGAWSEGIRVAKQLPAEATEWVDHTVASGQPYRYSVETVLANGLSTRSGWVD